MTGKTVMRHCVKDKSSQWTGGKISGCTHGHPLCGKEVTQNQSVYEFMVSVEWLGACKEKISETRRSREETGTWTYKCGHKV
jgi:hypothetical protein